MYGQTQIGTPLYMCPEIYKRERYDMYELKKNIYEGKLIEIPTDYSVHLKALLKKLLVFFCAGFKEFVPDFVRLTCVICKM